MKPTQNTCLNCGQIVITNFCENCGQRASTKRFTIHQLISNDFLVAFFSLEKGFFHTLKSLFTRPGHFVREYVEGKRVSYFHFLTFLLLVLGVYIFLDEFSSIKLSQLITSPDTDTSLLESYEVINKEYPRLLILILLPFTSLITYFWFKKAKYNFAEHMIINVFKSSGEFIILMSLSVLTIFYTNLEVLKPLYSLLTILLIIYSIWFYFQYFSPIYKNKWKLFFRVLFAYISLQISIGILVLFILGIVNGYKDQAQNLSVIL